MTGLLRPPTTVGPSGADRRRPLAAALAVLLATAACGGTAARHVGAGTPHRHPGGSHPVPASAAGGAHSVAGAEPDTTDPAYQAARRQWLAEGLVVGGALQAAPLVLAVADLQQETTAHPAAASADDRAIAAIEDFEGIPLTDATPAQSAEANADAAAVDAFFGLAGSAPGGSCGPTPTAAGEAAATQWDSEPTSAAGGVVPGPLEQAAGILQQAVDADPSTTGCYPAAVDDLDRLAAAPASDIAASQQAATSAPGTPAALDDAAIGYLNEFFSVVGNSSAAILGGAA